MSKATTHAAIVSCASCGRKIEGRFCTHCGEEVIDPHALTLRHFFTHTVLHEVAHVDGKLWRTTRSLLFRPGFLTAEYAAGRRRIYANPVRLLITAIIVYALATQGGLIFTLSLGMVSLSVTPVATPAGQSLTETIERIDRFGILERAFAKKKDIVDLNSPAAAEKFNAKLQGFAQPVSFANVVLLALVLYVLFRRKRPLFLHHSVFSIHLMSFVLLSSLLFLPGLKLLEVNEGLSLIYLLSIVVLQFVYIAVSIRRFYFEGQAGRRFGLLAAGAAIVIYISNSAFITAIQLLGGVIALATM